MSNSEIVFQGDNNQGGFNNINATNGSMGVDLTADQGIGLALQSKWIFSLAATNGQKHQSNGRHTL